MNAKTAALAALAYCAVCFTACDNDDDNMRPAASVEQAFDTKYPGASRVFWEEKSGYIVADFHDTEGREAEAWFDNLGGWWMTETDLAYADLPAPVRAAFEGSAYARWEREDVDCLERKNTAILYVIEVEQGDTEVALHYAADGTLLNRPTDGNNSGNSGYLPSLLPDALHETVSRLFPGATILDIEPEADGHEVDILDGNLHKELRFDARGALLYAEWELRTAEVPAAVLAGLKGSAYGAYVIDDIHARQAADGTLTYRFELEQGERDVQVMLDAAGKLLQ